jgi:MoxR-like ATPase
MYGGVTISCLPENRGNSREIQVKSVVEELQKRHDIIGRRRELSSALVAAQAGKHVLLEGPVGVGKTTIALAIASQLKRKIVRIDGDERYTEQKLAGWYDPPLVLSRGYTRDSFIPGPLSQSMHEGALLLINELNRMPEGTQNVMLTAMDERSILIPKYGQVDASEGFMLIATQNPDEYIGTSQLSEALRDRFICVNLGYQSEEEERGIVRLRSSCSDNRIITVAVSICRQTRQADEIRRGSSVRGAIDLADLYHTAHGEFEDTAGGWVEAAELSFLTKIELHDFSLHRFRELMKRLVKHALDRLRQGATGDMKSPASGQDAGPDLEQPTLDDLKKKSSH